MNYKAAIGDKMSRGKGCLAGVVGGSILRGLIKLIALIFKAIANILVFTGLWLPGLYALVGFILKITKKLDPLSSLGFKIGFFITVGIAVMITIKHIFAPSKKQKDKKEQKRLEKLEKKEKAENKENRLEPALADGPQDIGFNQPPAPYDNYPSKLSRKERRELKRISQRAKEDVYFQDEQLDTGNEYGSDAELMPVHPNTDAFNRPIPTTPIPNDPQVMPSYNNPNPYQTANMGYQNPPQNIAPAYPVPQPVAEEPKIYLSKAEENTLIHEFSDRFEVYKMIDGKAVKDRVEFKRDFSN